jgi:hypothetical protein
MKNYTKTLTGALGILLVSIILAGCSDFFTPPDSNGTVSSGVADVGLTRHDYLALLKTQKSHKASVDDIKKLVTDVLVTTPEGRSIASVGSVVTNVKRFPVDSDKRFIALTRGERSVQTEPEGEPVEIYELSVGQPGSDTEGFVLASNDDRIGNILVIAEGSLEEANAEFTTVLNANLQEYVDATIV